MPTLSMVGLEVVAGTSCRRCAPFGRLASVCPRSPNRRALGRDLAPVVDAVRLEVGLAGVLVCSPLRPSGSPVAASRSSLISCLLSRILITSRLPCRSTTRRPSGPEIFPRFPQCVPIAMDMGSSRAMRASEHGSLRVGTGHSSRCSGIPGLRRLQLAWVGSILGTWAYFVALAVYAYDQGGAGAVALVGVLRMVPGGDPVTVPRHARRPLPAAARDGRSRTSCARRLMVAAAAVDRQSTGPAWIVYAIVMVSTIAARRSARAGRTVPSARRARPAELTAANVASSTLESVGSFLGPGDRRLRPRGDQRGGRVRAQRPRASSGRRCWCSGSGSTSRRPSARATRTTAAATPAVAGFRPSSATATSACSSCSTRRRRSSPERSAS